MHDEVSVVSEAYLRPSCAPPCTLVPERGGAKSKTAKACADGPRRSRALVPHPAKSRVADTRSVVSHSINHSLRSGLSTLAIETFDCTPAKSRQASFLPYTRWVVTSMLSSCSRRVCMIFVTIVTNGPPAACASPSDGALPLGGCGAGRPGGRAAGTAYWHERGPWRPTGKVGPKCKETPR